ncbi:NADH-quinone oxidoreductase subunit A [Flexivirga meconopsidis]|uniref:NADH-quinone oxidoreductase subunit A n=1 Tax=Flexivirga meconopsidis TaxID=2977121 RepID=UPI00223FD8D4|nr:NADH-quinone oxidoreductase subunit A [Flexivirga meconopsidis]
MTGYLVLAGVGLAGALLFVAAMVARRLLAPRAPSLAKLTTYESGVDPVTGGWAQSHIRYVTYAFLYVVFAVDAVYLFPWALVLRDHRLGVVSLVEMGIFIAVLLVGLLHAARRGLLNWADSPQEGPRSSVAEPAGEKR